MNPKEIFEKNKQLSTMDPVFDHVFEVIFPISLRSENDYLTLMLKSVDLTTLTFNLLVDENKRIIPLNEIIALTKTKDEDLRVVLCRQDGETILSTIYHKCKFSINIDTLFILNSSSTGTQEMHVYFEYASKSVYDENNNKIS